MSNRRRAARSRPAKPPRVDYRCPDCASVVGRTWWDARLGMWQLDVAHDDTCPGLLGATRLPTLLVWFERDGARRETS